MTSFLYREHWCVHLQVIFIICRGTLEDLWSIRTKFPVVFSSVASPPGEMAAEKRASLECTHECLHSLTGSRLRCRVSFKQPHSFCDLYLGWCAAWVTVCSSPITVCSESSGSREPTCPELLKTTEMTEEEQRSEFHSLCRFYTLTCPPGHSDSACSQLAEDKCFTRFKKCRECSFSNVQFSECRMLSPLGWNPVTPKVSMYCM